MANWWEQDAPVAPQSSTGGNFWEQDAPVQTDSVPPELREEFGPVTGETGLLSDPARDREAWMRAKAMDAAKQRMLLPGFSNFNERISEGMLFNVDRPMSGAYHWLTGDGYDFGKAVDAYSDQMRDERMGLAGGATELVGGVLSPGATIGKGASWAKTALISALEGAGGSLLEGENLATEGNQRDWGDRAQDAAIGGTVSGALGGVGRLVDNDAATAPQSLRQLNRTIRDLLAGNNVPGIERAGLNFRDALTQEQTALAEAGKTSMREATGKGNVVLTGRPDYEAVRTNAGTQTIPITPEGTPSAAALKAQIDAVGDQMTLKQLDELRTQARGLRKQAVNETDRGAVDDLVRSLDNLMDANVTSGTIQGDPAYVKQYREGRATFEQAARLGSVKGLRAVIKDPDIPGKSIADSLLDITASGKSKNPAKIAAVVVDTLGPDSKTLETVRQGVLAKLLNNVPDNPAAQSKLLNTLNDNDELLNSLFTQEQRADLAKLQVALEATKHAREGDAAYVKNMNIVTMILGKLKPVGRAGGAALAGYGTTGNAGVGVGAGVASLLADAATSVPARRALLAAGRGIGVLAPGLEEAAPAVGRMFANPRETLINQLGAQ